MTNLYSRMAERFPHARDKVFAWLPDGGSISYAELDAASARYANALRAAGVERGARVAAQLEKSIDALLLYLACLRAGAVFLPLNPAYTVAELEHFVADAEPALVVCDPERRDAIDALPRFWGGIATLAPGAQGSLGELSRDQPARFATAASGADELAAILYTSGTTGRSKGAMLSHGNLASNAFVLRDAWRFSPDDVLLHALPIFHTHGLFVGTNVTLAAGASMIFQPRFEVDAVIGAIGRATVMMGVPTFYIRLLEDPRWTRGLVERMRLFVSGSAPLPPDVFRAFEERTGHVILERYGMTETNMNTSNPYDGERIAGTVGPALPDVSVRVVDPDTGAPLAQGEVGMVEVRGPNVFGGYWRQPERTATEFRDGYFITGDLGRIDANGYVSLVGRQKDLVIAGGYNVYPAEIEAAIGELDEVHEVAVVGVPHPDLGEGVVAAVVPRDPHFRDEPAIVAALASRLARFKQPRRVMFLDELPKNAMGKVQKTVLRERYDGLFQPSANADVPKDKVRG